MRLGAGVRRVAKLAAVLISLATTIPLWLLCLAGGRRRATSQWCRLFAWALGVRALRTGEEVPPSALVVSNHVGYLDPLVLGRFIPARFIAKSEIARWPLLGELTRVSGGIFVERDRPRAGARAVAAVADALERGDRVVLFPEAGVSPDGLRLAEFRPMLFQSAVTARCPVVPVAIRYTDPPDPSVWAWIGGASLAGHLWEKVLPAACIRAELRVGEPLRPAPGEGRKELAARTQEAIQRLLRDTGESTAAEKGH